MSRWHCLSIQDSHLGIACACWWLGIDVSLTSPHCCIGVDVAMSWKFFTRTSVRQVASEMSKVWSQDICAPLKVWYFYIDWFDFWPNLFCVYLILGIYFLCMCFLYLLLHKNLGTWFVLVGIVQKCTITFGRPLNGWMDRVNDDYRGGDIIVLQWGGGGCVFFLFFIITPQSV